MAIKCVYVSRCKKARTTSCMSCKHNTVRHMKEDFYEKAEDNPIPDKCPRLDYSGPAEQTLGYQCPVCGGFTNPYVLKDKLCSCCGYELNVC